MTAPGSMGDVNPLLAIARCLKARGMTVTFCAAERYLHFAEAAGLRTRILTNESDFSRLVGDPRIWHPRHGPRLILRHALQDFLEPHYKWLEERCAPGRTLLVSHLLDFAGRVFRDRHPGVPLATVLLAPAMLRSSVVPPRLSGFGWERRVPRLLIPAVYRLADWHIDRLCAPAVNRLRKRVGLLPVRRLLHDWWFSPDLVLGMFPDWFSVPAADLPPRFEHAGFPLADLSDLAESGSHSQIASVLERTGDRPFVVAPGTAHHHAGRFLQTAAEVCGDLGRGAVLLAPNPERLRLPRISRVVAAQYLPFSLLLPHASAIVHHGGVGTTSQAFAAGVRQVVLPMAYDQFDNAERVAAHGCGHWLPMRRLSASKLRALLQQQLELPRQDSVVARIGDGLSAVRRAADSICRLMASAPGVP